MKLCENHRSKTISNLKHEKTQSSLYTLTFLEGVLCDLFYPPHIEKPPLSLEVMAKKTATFLRKGRSYPRKRITKPPMEFYGKETTEKKVQKPQSKLQKINNKEISNKFKCLPIQKPSEKKSFICNTDLKLTVQKTMELCNIFKKIAIYKNNLNHSVVKEAYDL